ncbi:MAG: hypothetical protein ACLRWP_09775 [Bilophila wadsworthia]
MFSERIFRPGETLRFGMLMPGRLKAFARHALLRGTELILGTTILRQLSSGPTALPS